MSDSDAGPARLDDPAPPAEPRRVREKLEHKLASAASPDLMALRQRINDEADRKGAPQVITGQPGFSALPRLLAVEVLLAEPEALQDDCLESCLYVLRDRLRGAGKS